MVEEKGGEIFHRTGSCQHDNPSQEFFVVISSLMPTFCLLSLLEDTSPVCQGSSALKEKRNKHIPS